MLDKKAHSATLDAKFAVYTSMAELLDRCTEVTEFQRGIIEEQKELISKQLAKCQEVEKDAWIKSVRDFCDSRRKIQIHIIEMIDDPMEYGEMLYAKTKS